MSHDVEQVFEQYRIRQREYWRSLAGPIFDDLLGVQATAIRHLDNPDPKVRVVAIEVLFFHWGCKSDPDFRASCERLAFHDPDEMVRAVALASLGDLYCGTGDRRIGRLLASLVHDETESPKLRENAYVGLHYLQGATPPLPRRVTLPRGAELRGVVKLADSFPENVDWSFVDGFLVGTHPTVAREATDPNDARIDHLPVELRNGVRLAYKGYQAFDRAQYVECVTYVTDALRLNPELFGIHLLRGRANMKLGRLDEAIADFTHAIQLKPQSAETYRERSEAYKRCGLFELAEGDDCQATQIERESGGDEGSM